jgi:hypothetical protein
MEPERNAESERCFGLFCTLVLMCFEAHPCGEHRVVADVPGAGGPRRSARGSPARDRARRSGGRQRADAALRASAFRRITAARLVKPVPALLERIERGELHLSMLVLLSPHLDEQNVDELAAAVAGKTQRQVEELLARLAPEADVPSAIRSARRTSRSGSTFVNESHRPPRRRWRVQLRVRHRRPLRRKSSSSPCGACTTWASRGPMRVER